MTKARMLYTVADLLELLPMSRTELYRKMNAGQLAFIQAGRRRLFEPQAVEALISNIKQQSEVVDRLLALVDEDGRIDVAQLPEEATFADLAELKRHLAELSPSAA